MAGVYNGHKRALRTIRNSYDGPKTVELAHTLYKSARAGHVVNLKA